MQTRDYHLKQHRESWCEVHYANTVGEREVGTPKNIPLGSQVMTSFGKLSWLSCSTSKTYRTGPFDLNLNQIIRSRLYKKRKDHIIVLNWEISNKRNWFFTTATQARFVWKPVNTNPWLKVNESINSCCIKCFSLFLFCVVWGYSNSKLNINRKHRRWVADWNKNSRFIELRTTQPSCTGITKSALHM